MPRAIGRLFRCGETQAGEVVQEVLVRGAGGSRRQTRINEGARRDRELRRREVVLVEIQHTGQIIGGRIAHPGKAKAIRFSTLEAICQHLNCQPGDILEYRSEEGSSTGSTKGG